MLLKRDGSRQRVCAAKDEAHVRRQTYGLAGVDVGAVVAAALSGPPATTVELGERAVAAAAAAGHDLLAGRLAVDALHKTTLKSFSATVARLAAEGRVDAELARFVAAHARELDSAVVGLRDFALTLSDLEALDLITGERPQHALMRRACARGDVASAVAEYDAHVGATNQWKTTPRASSF